MALGRELLNVSSFNIKGFKNRNYEYVKYLFENTDILFLQETWLYDFESYVINNVLGDCQYHSISSMDDTDVVRAGRPFGGLAVVWKSSLSVNVVTVDCNSTRLCAVTMKYENTDYLLINVYMPVNDRTYESYNAFGDVLSEISSLLQFYDDHNIVIAGDFNFDFSQDNLFKNLFLQFLDDENLKCLSKDYSNNINFTFESTTGNRSFIDHIIVSENIFSSVSNYSIDINGMNLSDHFPLTCKFLSPIKNTIQSENKSYWYNDWASASEDHINHYKYVLDSLIDQIETYDVLDCNNFGCNIHGDIVMSILNEIMKAMVSAANIAIPKKKICHKLGIPGWNDFVKPSREKSIFWNEMWKQAGCPQNGHIAHIRKSTRIKYHKAVKFVKSNNDLMIKYKVANCLNKKRFVDFWAEIRKIKKPKNKCNVNTIDSCIGNCNIAHRFEEIYKNLYNSVQDNDKYESRHHVDELINKCVIGECSSSHFFSYSEINEAISSLKSNQKDYIYEIYSNGFINATTKLSNILQLVFSAILIHGCTDIIFNQSIIIPIVKNNRKSLNDSSNYRALTLGSTICKIFEYLLLNKTINCIKSDDYQFAFKSKHSTTLCTAMVLQTIEYYKHNNSNIFALFLDWIKAFDKIKHSKLFNILIGRNVCPLIIRIIVNMHGFNNSRVNWNSTKSNNF